MTDERKKYLASISKEERAIRYELGIQRSVLRNNKILLCVADNEEVKGSLLGMIQETKIIIKSLKKQLPAPRRYWSSFRLACNCPICNNQVIKKDDYCPKCGQKLR